MNAYDDFTVACFQNHELFLVENKNVIYNVM